MEPDGRRTPELTKNIEEVEDPEGEMEEVDLNGNDGDSNQHTLKGAGDPTNGTTDANESELPQPEEQLPITDTESKQQDDELEREKAEEVEQTLPEETAERTEEEPGEQRSHRLSEENGDGKTDLSSDRPNDEQAAQDSNENVAEPKSDVQTESEAELESQTQRQASSKQSLSSLAAPLWNKRSRRSPSIALSISSTTTGQPTVSSMVFIKKAFESIKTSKDARRVSALENAVGKALKQLESDNFPAPKVIFEPLRIVCSQSSNNDLKVIALDCIAKLLSFSYFEDPEPVAVDPSSGITPPPAVPMIHQVVMTVSETYQGEGTDGKVEIQILKALLAAVLNEELIAHGDTLLKAVRQTYNIFVLSTSNQSQVTAQATLTQMANVVFERVKNVLNMGRGGSLKNSGSSLELAKNAPPLQTRSSESDIPPPVPPKSPSPSDEQQRQQQLTLRQMTRAAAGREDEEDYETDSPHINGNGTAHFSDEADRCLKDAFLVFRTMCKLSEKPVEGDSSLKSPEIRSKLLALTLVHSMLKSHMSVFASDNAVIRTRNGEQKFVAMSKDYINSTLARNAANILAPVFEISAEIFWLIVSNLRRQFKLEIPVFFGEIYFPILEMRTSTAHQKIYFLTIINKICNDPRALVEIYLNYDCDRRSPLNIYEHVINSLVKMAVTSVTLNPTQMDAYLEWKDQPLAHYNLSAPMGLSSGYLSQLAQAQAGQEALGFPMEFALKVEALESLVAVLRSLLTWSQRGLAAVASLSAAAAAAAAETSTATSPSVDESDDLSSKLSPAAAATSETVSPNSSTPLTSVSTSDVTAMTDDPMQFESLKHRKAALSAAIREFNFNSKRGLKRLIREGFINSDTPQDVAAFLMETEGLDKAMIGDFLGGDDKKNLDIMHAFVDLIDFKGLTFVDGMRAFLQTFRLPGEAQKIDRFMLKFAERYILDNPAVFSNADTPYILAYSVIMLNTDQHSPEVKKRMTVQEFIKNNRGINDHSDLPDAYLTEIYNEIVNNEIKLLSEQHAALISSSGKGHESGGPFGALGALGLPGAGRDLQREAYMRASREMANKTEQMFKTLVSSGRSEEIFYIASHIEHVKPMFEVVWMSFLAGFSGPFRETEESTIIDMCVEGIRLCIRIACLFDVELARISFVSALAKFANLQNLSEMKLKNVNAGKVLLSTALSEGNMLKESWKDVLRCISQLERLQLIAAGIEAGEIPDVIYARIASRESVDTVRSSHSHHHPHHNSTNHPLTVSPQVGKAIRSTEIIVDMDKIFTQSSQLSGDAIVQFVKALTEVSWEEIQSSGNSENPRMFSLQKMVDVSYYNMERIRVEWSQLWSIMGESFNQMVSHENVNVVSFALDSLRQLSLRFFDIQELSHFKFQKDFLKPFEYAMLNNQDASCKDLVLQCLQQMLLAKSECIKSGWTTMFAVFSAAATVPNASIITTAYQLTKKIYDEYLYEVIAQGGFKDWIRCLTDLVKNRYFQKVSLHSVELLRSIIPRIPEIAEKSGVQDVYNELWFPILSAYHDTIMNGEDLEVRSRALNYLFDTLVEHGGSFEPEFWDKICRQLLFPIFVVLKSRSTKTKDELSVWLSTTMIQALRNMVALLTFYFDTLSRMLEGFLDLLVTCVDQDNDTVSRIGSSCLFQLVEQNVERLKPEHWKLIVDKMVYLFERTSANELLDGSLLNNAQNEKNKAVSNNSSGPNKSASPETFRAAIIKSILQLLMIDLVEEMMENEKIYRHMPTNDIVRLCQHLKESYGFARRFNSDRQLRMELWHQGFMKQMPNLLKQESTSANSYINIMFRLYKDETKSQGAREDIEKDIIEQSVDVLSGYNSLEAQEQRYINTLWPVVVRILTEYQGLSDQDFKSNMTQLYPAVVDILSKDMSAQVREVVREFLSRTGRMLQNVSL